MKKHTAIVQSPEKLEGKPIYAEYFYEKTFNVNTAYYVPSHDKMYYIFTVDGEDKAEFSELNNIYGVILYVTETGFIQTLSFENENDFRTVASWLEELSV